MAITLNDFRTLSNGEYNAGQIDFTTNDNGEVTGLKKAVKDDVNHQNDGHQKAKANQL